MGESICRSSFQQDDGGGGGCGGGKKTQSIEDRMFFFLFLMAFPRSVFLWLMEVGWRLCLAGRRCMCSTENSTCTTDHGGFLWKLVRIRNWPVVAVCSPCSSAVPTYLHVHVLTYIYLLPAEVLVHISRTGRYLVGPTLKAHGQFAKDIISTS